MISHQLHTWLPHGIMSLWSSLHEIMEYWNQELSPPHINVIACKCLIFWTPVSSGSGAHSLDWKLQIAANMNITSLLNVFAYLAPKQQTSS